MVPCPDQPGTARREIHAEKPQAAEGPSGSAGKGAGRSNIRSMATGGGRRPGRIGGSGIDLPDNSKRSIGMQTGRNTDRCSSLFFKVCPCDFMLLAGGKCLHSKGGRAGDMGGLDGRGISGRVAAGGGFLCGGAFFPRRAPAGGSTSGGFGRGNLEEGRAEGRKG